MFASIYSLHGKKAYSIFNNCKIQINTENSRLQIKNPTLGIININ